MVNFLFVITELAISYGTVLKCCKADYELSVNSIRLTHWLCYMFQVHAVGVCCVTHWISPWSHNYTLHMGWSVILTARCCRFSCQVFGGLLHWYSVPHVSSWSVDVVSTYCQSHLNLLNLTTVTHFATDKFSNGSFLTRPELTWSCCYHSAHILSCHTELAELFV